ncbi:hypothetical protein BGZ60DRAFT_471785 [Tricladium varicosporioides]|nr:hypothetical protein BGZ60DRAFT_471785 [Hymenoscyphus varicosporioides]
MPHTNRKKKSARGDGGVKALEQKRVVVHTKRSEVVDDSGWTHVVDTPRTRRGTVSKNTNLQHAGDFEVNGVAFVNRTLPEIKEECQYWRNNWNKSDASTKLRTILEEKTSAGKQKISNVVVLGLGSLQIARMEGRRASCTQLGALDHILEFLLPNEKLRVAFQDPIHTDLDKEFLIGRGQYVVEDPAGFQEIGEDTLVYAIHCYGDIYRKMSESKKPAVLICTDMDNFGKFNL